MTDHHSPKGKQGGTKGFLYLILVWLVLALIFNAGEYVYEWLGPEYVSRIAEKGWDGALSTLKWGAIFLGSLWFLRRASNVFREWIQEAVREAMGERERYERDDPDL